MDPFSPIFPFHFHGSIFPLKSKVFQKLFYKLNAFNFSSKLLGVLSKYLP